MVPIFHDYGTYRGLDGVAGKFDHLDLWTSTDPFTAFIYGLGDLFCHQEESRSFMINGSQMPFCSRDISIFIGIIIGLVSWEILQLYADPKGKVEVVFASLLILIMIMEWIIENQSGSNMLFFRVVTGTMAGFGIGSLIWAYSDHEFGIKSNKV
ncbi:MAG: DUF2085 domain-containing protein [Candidatus Methanogranum gryphiswaldense]|nr:MAG: DUF2085 domain-containing protein [Candidatus Methanogranum sp. U3.2.1]